MSDYVTTNHDDAVTMPDTGKRADYVLVCGPTRFPLTTLDAHRAQVSGIPYRIETAPHSCDSVTTPDGHGAFCPTCGETTA